MSASKEQIARLMSIGKPRANMMLRWFGKETFFDDGVQEVLLEMHPALLQISRDEVPDEAFKALLALPIAAWSLVDSVARCQPEDKWDDLTTLLQLDLLWTTELLRAVLKARAAEQKPYTETALDEVKAWRGTRYLWETDRPKYSHAAAVRHNTLVKKSPNVEAEVERIREEERKRDEHPLTPLRTLRTKVQRLLKIAHPPLPISEAMPPPKKWLDGKRRSLSPEAYRQAVLRENRRRDQIMAHWTECWLAYLSGDWAYKNSPKK